MSNKIYTLSDMAEELDVSVYSIRKLIKRFKFVGIFKNIDGNQNVLVYPQTVFDMLRDSLESNKVLEKNYYTSQQVADLAGVTPSCVSNTAIRNHIERIVRPMKKSKVAFYSKEDAEKIVEIITTRRDKRFKVEKKKAEETEKETIDLEELHPLVTDKRCLKLGFWPDVTPKCFADIDN